MPTDMAYFGGLAGPSGPGDPFQRNGLPVSRGRPDPTNSAVPGPGKVFELLFKIRDESVAVLDQAFFPGSPEHA